MAVNGQTRQTKSFRKRLQYPRWQFVRIKAGWCLSSFVRVVVAASGVVHYPEVVRESLH